MTEEKDRQAAEEVVKDTTVTVPQPAWQTLERLQLAAQVSQQQLQVFVDGLALGQGIAQGAQLTQMPQGGWCWVEKELPAAA